MNTAAEKNYEMPIKELAPEQMAKRVARFSELKYPPDRYPDSQLPGNVRKNYLVVGHGLIGKGFNDPMSAIPIDEGFQLSYVACEPGNGPRLHNHDTNETFMPLSGQWRCSWEVDGAVEHFDVGPWDVVSFPAGVNRRFENITHGEPDKTHFLMFVISGNAPEADFTQEAKSVLREAGLYA